LQACLHEGIVPAVYVAPGPHLAEQVTAEAVKLGLSVVDDPANAKFLAGGAVCVTTMQVLLNGRADSAYLVPLPDSLFVSAPW